VLVDQTREALDRGEQALILLNRRGYSFAVICRACGEKLECQNCAISLTHHKPPGDDAGVARAGQRLECHYCGFSRTVPPAAPSATASTSTISAPDRNRAKSGWRRYFPPRASAAWIAIRCADATIWNGCSRASTPARSTCWWVRK